MSDFLEAATPINSSDIPRRPFISLPNTTILETLSQITTAECEEDHTRYPSTIDLTLNCSIISSLLNELVLDASLFPE
jgi:hypothetical protein